MGDHYKLRMLTVLSLASKSKVLKYTALMTNLGVKDTEEAGS